MGWEVTWLCVQFSISGRELFAEVKYLAMAQAQWVLCFIQNLRVLFALREVQKIPGEGVLYKTEAAQLFFYSFFVRLVRLQ